MAAWENPALATCKRLGRSSSLSRQATRPSGGVSRSCERKRPAPGNGTTSEIAGGVVCFGGEWNGLRRLHVPHTNNDRTLSLKEFADHDDWISTLLVHVSPLLIAPLLVESLVQKPFQERSATNSQVLTTTYL